MLNSYSLLSALQAFLRQREVEVERLRAEPALTLMADWFRLVPADKLEHNAAADVLVHRYGGWSEGCATGFNFSLLRRVTTWSADGGDTDWFAGITLMYEPSLYAQLPAYSSVSADWKSLEAFLESIETSRAFKMLSSATPMSVLLESGGLR
jgi:hypothetical protein